MLRELKLRTREKQIVIIALQVGLTTVGVRIPMRKRLMLLVGLMVSVGAVTMNNGGNWLQAGTEKEILAWAKAKYGNSSND